MNTIRDYVVSIAGISDTVVVDCISGMILFFLVVLCVGCFAWFLNRVFSI